MLGVRLEQLRSLLLEPNGAHMTPEQLGRSKLRVGPALRVLEHQFAWLGGWPKVLPVGA